MAHFTRQQLSCLTITLFCCLQISLAQPPPSLGWAIRPESVSGPDTPTEVGQAIVRDKAGNVYVTGYFMNTVNFGPGYSLTSAGNSDVFIAKYTSTGSILWAKAIGGVSADIVQGIAVDASDNIYITGQFNGTADFDPGSGTQNRSSNGGTDAFLAKYNNTGTYQWAYTFGSTGQDAGMAVAVDANDNVLVTGVFNGTVNFNPAGTTNLTEAASNALTGFVAQYTSSGSLNWANAFGGPTASLGLAVATDASRNVYLTGYFTSLADFAIGLAGGEISGASTGVPDGFVARYSSTGAFVYAKPFGGNQVDMGFSLAIDAAGNAFVTGYYTSSADFDTGNPGGEVTVCTASPLIIKANPIALPLPIPGVAIRQASVAQEQC